MNCSLAVSMRLLLMLFEAHVFGLYALTSMEACTKFCGRNLMEELLCSKRISLIHIRYYHQEVCFMYETLESHTLLQQKSFCLIFIRSQTGSY